MMKKPETSYIRWYKQAYPGKYRWRHDDLADRYNAQYELFLLEEKLSRIHSHLKNNPKDAWAREAKIAKANDLEIEIKAKKVIMVLQHGREILDTPRPYENPKWIDWEPYTDGYSAAPKP